MHAPLPSPAPAPDACTAELDQLAERLRRGEIQGMHLIVIVSDDEREYLALGNVTPTPLTDRHITTGA